MAVSYSYDGNGVGGWVGGPVDGGGRWLEGGGRDEVLGVSRGHGGGGRPTEGGEDRDTKGFDVQPFHRLYFSAPFYPFAVHHPIRANPFHQQCSSAAKAAID